MENNLQTNAGGRGSRKKRREQQREAKEMDKKKEEKKKEEMEKERKKMEDQERKMLKVAFHNFIKNSDLMIEEEEEQFRIESNQSSPKPKEDDRRDEY